jgi:hypothetical protein
VHLTRSTLVGLAEEKELSLIVERQDTSTGNTTENVGTSTLEERLDTFLGDDLAGSIEGTVVLDGLTRGHHHTTTDSIKRVRSNTSTSGNAPSKSERSKEVALERTNKENRLERIVHTEVQTAVNDNTEDGWTESTVETRDTIRGKGLLVDVDETVELSVTSTLLGGLGIVGKTSTGVIEGVDEEEGGGTSHTTGGKVTSHPLGVSITFLLEAEHALVGITESEVQGLSWEITDDVGSVTTPQRDGSCRAKKDELVPSIENIASCFECKLTLSSNGSSEAVSDTVVLAVETTGLEHFILRSNVKSAAAELMMMKINLSSSRSLSLR